MTALLPHQLAADSFRLAFFHTELQRTGPGLMLRDAIRGDPQVEAVARVVARAAPDILVLGGIDWDMDGHGLNAVASRISAAGHALPHRFAAQPNTGMATGLDLDGDGRRGGPGDAQGFGDFAGQAGLAVLSRFPIAQERMLDLSDLLWADLPGATPPVRNGTPFPDADSFAIQRLSSKVHWDLPVVLPGGQEVRLLIFHASPPAFDGPEARNRLRNRDEAGLWLRHLEGALSWPAPEGPLALIGAANIDPVDGDGFPEAIAALLDHPRLQDPRPSSRGGAIAAVDQGGVNISQGGDPALDTADWGDGPNDPGNLRVDYILPSRDLRVLDAGVLWPAPDDPLAGLAALASRHRLIWVDLEPQG